MTAAYQPVYLSVVRCDGVCDKVSVDDFPYNCIEDAVNAGKSHLWAVGEGDSHYCDDCWCTNCDGPIRNCFYKGKCAYT